MNPSTAQARAVVDELVLAGVTEAVLCPGSRNAPLSFALRDAEQAGRLRLHVRIDERTAAFLALGLGLGSGRPVPVVCTSGTAAANFHPAVLEADYAGVPLLAVTADRPPELIGVGANQAIVQPGLYADAPRAHLTLGVAGRDGDESDWRAVVRRAVRIARGGPGSLPGPVHLNAPFADPLVPGPAAAPVVPLLPAPPPGGAAAAAPGPVARARARDPEPGPAGGPVGAPPALPMDPALPTLVIGGAVPTGPVPGPPAGAGSAAGPGPGAPVIAEPGSPLWPDGLRTGPWLLDAPDRPPPPAQVLLHGRPTLHRAVTRLLADPGVAVYAVAGTVGDELPPSVRAVGVPPPLRPPAGWAAAWADADRRASAALDTALDTASDPAPEATTVSGTGPGAGSGGGLTGRRLAAALVAAVPVGAVLLVGSSNPVRDVALAAAPRRGVRVLANRGVAGIDGTLSTAIGAALAHAADGGGPGYALVGDLTALHDLTALVLGPAEPRPDLTVVVLNDSGGGIFSLLEQGAPEHAASFERVFGTPHQVRLDALCAGFGIPHLRVEDPGRLAGALGGVGDGMRVVEVPASRDGLRDGHAALRAAVHRAVADRARTR